VANFYTKGDNFARNEDTINDLHLHKLCQYVTQFKTSIKAMATLHTLSNAELKIVYCHKMAHITQTKLH